MLQFEGNTATFLLYSYVRTVSIQRKVGLSIDALLPVTDIVLEHPSEIQLALHLNRFGELLELMANDLLPHHLTDYLYQLAEQFNAFFRDCRVEGTEQQNSRLLLCALTTKVLRQGLTLLGLKVTERM
jgi:arginyl-tRNA synthetase